MRPLLAALSALLLTACATAPPDATAGTRRATASASSRAAGKSAPKTAKSAPATAKSAASPANAAAPTWGERYYLDDGPGDSPPPDLDSIPDPVPVEEPLHNFANRPYSVFGVDYEPQSKASGYSKKGLASWYGRRFHGKPTSSGEPYDMYKLSAAHPTLPIPSYARVTNLANGRSVIVRINDRGPFHPSRLIDLSYAAAWKLGYANQGSTRVLVEGVGPDDVLPSAQEQPEAAPPPPATASGTWLQLGSFASRDNAERLRHEAATHVASLADSLQVVERSGHWRVIAGPLQGESATQKALKALRDALGVRAIRTRP